MNTDDGVLGYLRTLYLSLIYTTRSKLEKSVPLIVFDIHHYTEARKSAPLIVFDTVPVFDTLPCL